MFDLLKILKSKLHFKDIKKANTPEQYIGEYLYRMDTNKKNEILNEISSIYNETEEKTKANHA